MNWCILRTAPSRTVPLVAALVEAGFVAWTPQESRVVRVGHCRKQKEVTVPMTPTIAFADYDLLPALVALSRSPVSALPPFHVFRHLDTYPRVADRALDALRLAEQRGRPRALARVFHQDEAVKFADAGFEGLIGRVDGVRGRYTLVTFPGFNFPVQIPAHSLMAA